MSQVRVLPGVPLLTQNSAPLAGTATRFSDTDGNVFLSRNVHGTYTWKYVLLASLAFYGMSAMKTSLWYLGK